MQAIITTIPKTILFHPPPPVLVKRNELWKFRRSGTGVGKCHYGEEQQGKKGGERGGGKGSVEIGGDFLVDTRYMPAAPRLITRTENT